MSEPAIAEWPVVMRPSKDEDLDFVRTTWADSLYHEAPWRKMRRSDFKGGHRAVMAYQLGRKHARCIVACAPDGEPKYGWALAHLNVLHYVYVRGMFRRSGIGTRLVTEVERLVRLVEPAVVGDRVISCITKHWRFMEPRFPSRYNPFRATNHE